MHIVQRSQPNLDLFRIRGRLDEPGVHQLAFLLRAMPVSRAALFDLRRLSNAREPGLGSLLEQVRAHAPHGKQVEFLGLPHTTVTNHTRRGVREPAFS